MLLINVNRSYLYLKELFTLLFLFVFKMQIIDYHHQLFQGHIYWDLHE